MSTQVGSIKKKADVELVGRGTLALQPSHYVTSGGEGAIYRPSLHTIIKLYSDTDKMVREAMDQKIELLSKIQHPFIVAPKGLVLIGGKPAGFYMPYEEGEALAKIFTTSYRQREQFGDPEAYALVDGMRTVVEEAHKHHATLVDANELNWLVSRKQPIPEPRIIDVDSWSIGKWKPSVIMPSIRDYHTHGFNERSDWFSFGVVTFQVFTGIHPYKGMLNGYKPNDVETRMREKKSVFTPGVRLNSAVRDFSCIPVPLLEWYEQVFEGNERSVPPTTKDKSNRTPQAAATKRIVLTGSGMLVFDVRFDGVNDTPVRIHPAGVVELASGKLVSIQTGKLIGMKTGSECEVITTDNGFLVACYEKTQSKLTFTLTESNGIITPVETQLTGKRLFRSENRLFLVSDDKMNEVKLKQFGQKNLLTLGQTWQVMGNSTTWFDGVGIQDTLGTPYAIMPVGDAGCIYSHLPELEGQRIVQAIAGMRYLVILALDPKTGSYHRYEYVFDKTYQSRTLRKAEHPTPELNMVALPKGVCASIVDDGELLISVPTQATEKVVQDSHMNMSLVLQQYNNTVACIEGSKVWSIKLK